MNPSDALFTLMLVLIGPAILMGMMYLKYRTRQLQHMERIAAIEKGAPLPPIEHEAEAGKRADPHRQYLLRGMIWLFAGLAATGALLAIAAGQGRPFTAEEKVWRATDARVRGATEKEIELLINDPNARAGLQIPIGVALLGLVPGGVGLAYLIFYGMERRNLLS